MKETELYNPVKELFELLGYEVKSEVSHCDVVAYKPDTYIVAELKLSINLTLILQAVERQKLVEHVYIAVPQKCLTRKNKVHKVLHLCSRLEIGVISVNKSTAKVILDCNFLDRSRILSTNKRKRIKLVDEFKQLNGDNNTGGQTGEKIHTVYRQKCIAVAKLLLSGENSAAELIKLGADAKAYYILRYNYYGWFEHAEKRGYYKLTNKGREEIAKIKIN